METEDKIHVFKDIYYYVPESTAKKPIDTLFQEYPKAQQYWRRQNDLPKYFYDYNPHLPAKKLCPLNATVTSYSGDKLVSLSVQDTQELLRLVKREVSRMKNGVYLMNNGIRIYLPGFYYGVLQWVKMIGVKDNDGYGEHRRYQREWACQRQKVIDDNDLDGYYVQKIKKCGGTQFINGCYVIESIVFKQYTSVSMSKNHDTCKSANFKYYSYGLKSLPNVLRPSIEQKGWGSAVQKIQIRDGDPELSMENVVAAVPTTEDGLDGWPPIKRICLSEWPKMAYAEKILTKSKEQARIQKTKIGIIEIESYPPEDDLNSFKYCKKFHTEECHVLDERGYPQNRMIPLYIGLLEATDKTFDIYGEPNKILALQLEQKERDKCDTPEKLQVRKRQYHINIKESWETGGGGSVYNNIALTEQETVLEEQIKFGELNYTQGNLEWTEGRISAVRFVPLTHKEIMDGKEAKWRIYLKDAELEKFIAEKTNLCFKMPRKKKIINGQITELLQPPDTEFNVAGTDPVDYGFVSEMGKKKSTNASVVRDITGRMISDYYYRGEDPDESIDDFCMEMVFFGLRSVVEGNRKNAVTSLEKLGMYFFMLIRHTNGEIKPYSQNMSVKHVSSGKDLKSLYISLITKHIKNNIEFFQSIPIIQQHKEFEPDKTQEYDYAVADGLSFVALDAMQTWLISKKSVSEKYAYMKDAMAYLYG